jgi:hypothetical protein
MGLFGSSAPKISEEERQQAAAAETAQIEEDWEAFRYIFEFHPQFCSTQTHQLRDLTQACSSQPGIAVRVVSVTGLPHDQGRLDPYVVLHCGDERFTTSVIKKATDPSWKEEFFLFRDCTEKSMIVVEVRAHSLEVAALALCVVDEELPCHRVVSHDNTIVRHTRCGTTTT